MQCGESTYLFRQVLEDLLIELLLMEDLHYRFQINWNQKNAAPLLCGGITVYAPLRIYKIKPHHKVGVIGIGGLGHLAVQYAAAMGCEVTAFSTSPDKEKEAKELGARNFIVSKDDEQLESVQGTLDYVISAVTVGLDWEEILEHFTYKWKT